MNLSLNVTQWKSILRGALVAAVGAGLAYLYQGFTGNTLGDSGPLAAAMLAVVANYVRKVLGIGETPTS